jgi:hypothetical protein
MLLTVVSSLIGQTHWNKYGQGPILPAGGVGEWDDQYIGTPFILEVDDTLRMWHSGCEANDTYYQIGYAWSLDGIEWHQLQNPVLSYGSSGDWDDMSVFSPTVLYDGGEYTMYYSAWSDADDNISTGMATSSDGIHWLKDIVNNPVFTGTHDGSWDDDQVAAFGVEWVESEYVMWYTGSALNEPYQIGRATSPDGLSWTRNDPNVPILRVGDDGEFDDAWIVGGSICLTNGSYEIFYHAVHSTEISLGYASGDDGQSFSKSAWNPILECGPSAYDDWRVIWPFVNYDQDSGLYTMWYEGIGATFLHPAGICLAHSLAGYRGLDIEEVSVTPGTPQQIIVQQEGPADGLTLNAQLLLGNEIVDTVMLLDDGLHGDGQAGDEFFGNQFNLDASESFYRVSLQVDREGDSLISYPNLAEFTTAGPAEVVSPEFPPTDPILHPGESSAFYFNMENLGTVATLPSVTARFNTDDPYVLTLSSNLKIFGDIEPGAIVRCTVPLTINISSICPEEYDIPIEYQVYSNGVLYWEGVYLIHVGTVSVVEHNLPENFLLLQNYPNPFNPNTRIDYAVPEATVFRLAIYDAAGKEVRELYQGSRDPGVYQVDWDGQDAWGKPVAAGVYVARLEAGADSHSITMVYLK